ncbi:uncharacterized mitochondrial protein AtMg00810-like [Hibiscus syriacus]|uniref:uncharacterized mitochondrial protein AtMg00810-like n=1 Tax=Hibiscus syriacus TaxID=106335 RepID=UPI001924941E|nr:uncharacterized mitochondrial protein AtMg00810-like [Hibiscus syriacus]
MGFQMSKADASLFVSLVQGEVTYVLVYVDGIVITGQSTTAIDQVVHALRVSFSLKDLGELYYFLGVKVQRSNDGIMLSQKKFILKMLAKSGLSKATPTITHMLAVRVVAFAYADWGGCVDDRRSMSGQYVLVGGNLVSWSTNK